MMHVKRYVACQPYPSTPSHHQNADIEFVRSYSADMVASRTFFLLGSLGEMVAPNPTPRLLCGFLLSGSRNRVF